MTCTSTAEQTSTTAEFCVSFGGQTSYRLINNRSDLSLILSETSSLFLLLSSFLHLDGWTTCTAQTALLGAGSSRELGRWGRERCSSSFKKVKEVTVDITVVLY